MKNIKKFFGTPAKATLSIISLTTIIAALGTGTVYAAGTIAQNSSIGAENAKNFSFADAGIDPTIAKEVKAEFDYEQGQFVYEVEFIADGTEYEYWIKASDGTVVKKDIEIKALGSKTEATSTQITLTEAKEIALKDANLTSDAVTFTTTKLDTEDNILVYELEFYAGNVEYEYDINANDGSIYSKSKEINAENKQQSSAEKAQETTKTETTKSETKETTSPVKQSETKNNDTSTKPVTKKKEASTNRISLDTAKAKALSDAGVTASSITYTEAKLDHDDGIYVYEIEFYTSTHEYEYEINAATGAIHDKSVEKLEKKTKKEQSKTKETSKSGESSAYIGIDRAKSIAVEHAGLSTSDVTFSKAKLDTDDGRTIYDIEFYKGGIEYEYEIDATSGKILEHSAERDDD